MTMRIALATTVALLTLTSAAGTQQAVTLDALLSAPFPSEIAAAPTGGRVAWVQNAKGARNVWMASAPEFAPRQLTTYGGDDGQDITNLTWTSDGRVILYVRGGGPNRQGEVPNPALGPEPAEQALWAVETMGTTVPRKLASGSGPAVSSRGDVAFLVRGQVWATNVAGTERPAPLFSTRGQSRDLRWSPDGARLAFVSGRGDHSFIGVYDGRRRRCATSTRASISTPTRPGRPTARASSSRACRRRARTSCSLRVARRCPGRFASPTSRPGAASRGLAGGAGSGQRVPGCECGATARCGRAGDRIVFPWERDGWIHLYSVPCRGGEAALLTPGAFEVEHVALTPDRAQRRRTARIRPTSIAATSGRVAGGRRARPWRSRAARGAEWMPRADRRRHVALRSCDRTAPAPPPSRC